jgi:signal transduction histidine kinase
MIQDFGVGMSNDQIDQIFQKSNQTTLGTKGEKGSGLGLFLVMELLQKIDTPLTI